MNTFFLLFVLSNLSIFTEVEATDCSGLLSQREFGQIDGHHILQNGEYAAGQFLGRSFVPVLYFNTSDEATSCAQGMDIARWNGRTWVRSR